MEDYSEYQSKEQLAKKYAKTRRILSLTSTVIFFAVVLILLFTGLSKNISAIAYEYSANDYIALLIFVAIIGIGESIITFPIGFYSDYILEHKYGMSNQTIGGYFKEKLKGLVLGLALGIPLLLLFYYILSNTGDNWWLVFGCILFLFTVIIGQLAPVLIMPLFYKFRPIENENIKSRLIDLCKKTGVMVKGIFVFDMSKNTKKANAAFTGMGKTKRIILGDTLLNNFTEDEIETVFAHEMGHYTRKHIIKLVAVSTILTFGGLYLTALLYKSSLSFFGFTQIYEIAALPLLFLYLSLYSLVTSPITNILSRKFEWEADTYALEVTKNNTAYISALEKLADQNLAEKEPNRFIEFLFHSHPSLSKRIDFARNFRS
ncbi:MAG TPA: M48 family metallopeptidase [Ignavibacteria bacterium]|nr:M48 family metallopeptidase [Ignavibacteria bacterium]